MTFVKISFGVWIKCPFVYFPFIENFFRKSDLKNIGWLDLLRSPWWRCLFWDASTLAPSPLHWRTQLRFSFTFFLIAYLDQNGKKLFALFVSSLQIISSFFHVSLFNFALNNYVSFRVVSLSNILNYFALSLADWFLVQTIYRIEVSKIMQHLLSIQLFTQIPCGMQKLWVSQKFVMNK